MTTQTNNKQLQFTTLEWAIFSPMSEQTMFDSKNPEPRAFLVLLNIARETIGHTSQKKQWVVAKEMYPRHRDSEYQSCLNMVNCLIEIGLVKRNTEDEQQVSLTTDGKHKLIGAIKARNKMREISGLTVAQICQKLAEDELEDWQNEMFDRVSQPSWRMGKSTFKPQCAIRRIVSRENLVDDIIQAALLQRQTNADGLQGLWEGIAADCQKQQ